MPLPDRFIDEHSVEFFVQLQVNVVNPAAIYTLLQFSPNLVVYRVQVLLAGHRAGAMKSAVSQVNSCMVSCALWAGALIVLLKSKEVARQVANG